MGSFGVSSIHSGAHRQKVAEVNQLATNSAGRVRTFPPKFTVPHFNHGTRAQFLWAPPSRVRSQIDFMLTIPKWSDFAPGQFLRCSRARSLQEARAEWRRGHPKQ